MYEEGASSCAGPAAVAGNSGEGPLSSRLGAVRLGEQERGWVSSVLALQQRPGKVVRRTALLRSCCCAGRVESSSALA